MKRDLNYIGQLTRATKEYGSIISFGLDPVLTTLHSDFPKTIQGFYLMLEELFDYMKGQSVYPGAFKPNHGFYSIHGDGRTGNFQGLYELGQILNLIDATFPDMPTILDFKRGDIGKSSANYGEEGFKFWNADAVTISPYMGDDSIIPFAQYCDLQLTKEENRGVYVLNLTSNPGASLFEMKKMADGKELYMHLADWIRTNASKYPGLGAVVGAPNLNGLRGIAKFYTDTDAKIPLLIPGVGGQGGKADEVTDVLNGVGYDLDIVRINVSSGLTHPWGEKEKAPDDWKKMIVANLFQYNRLTGMA